MVAHAMNEFDPNTVCYSTCSIYNEENERVVLRTLNSCVSYECVYPLPFQWPEIEKEFIKKRKDGVTIESLKKVCVHSSVQEHECRGFFIAKFVKKGDKVEEVEEKVATTEDVEVVKNVSKNKKKKKRVGVQF